MRGGFRHLLLWLLALLVTTAAAYSQTVGETLAGLDSSFQDVKPQKKVALVIGAEQYQWEGKLRYTGKDAHDFRDYLVKSWGFSDSSVILLTDDNPDAKYHPTQKNINIWIDNLTTKMIQSDTHVVVFFSGHGVRLATEDWMAPVDARIEKADDIPRECVSATKLQGRLEELRPQRALLFFDMCRNPVDDGTRGVVIRQVKKEEEKPPTRREMATVFSCDATEESREGQEFRQGVFTYFLLAGLSGQEGALTPEGTVTFDSLVDYVNGSVNQYVTTHFGKSQKPYGLASAGRMVLARFKPARQVAVGGEAAQFILSGYNALGRNLFTEAEKFADRALELDGTNPIAHYLKAKACRGQKKIQEAVLGYRETLRLDPNFMAARDELKEFDGGQGSPQDLLAQADAQLVQGKPDEAARLAEAARAADPNSAPVYYMLGRIYRQRKDTTAALAAFQKALDIQPGFTQASAALAEVQRQEESEHVARLIVEAEQFANAGQWPQAEEHARAVLASSPDNARAAQARVVLGRALYARHELEKSLKELGDAQQLDPNSPEARQRAEFVRQAYDGYSQATKAYDLLGKQQFQEAERAAQASLKATDYSSANAIARYVLGAVYESGGRRGDALREYQIAQGLQPEWDKPGGAVIRLTQAMSPGVSFPQTPAAWQALFDKDPAAAAVQARAAAITDPDGAYPRYILGMIEERAGQTAEARRWYQEAIRIDPTLGPAREASARLRQADAAPTVELARQSLKFGDYLAAEAKAREALSYSAQDAEAHAWLGVALLSRDKDKQALAEIQEALRLNDHLPAAHIAYGQYRFWSAHDKGKDKRDADYGQAIQAFSRARDLDPNNIVAYQGLGATYMELGQLDQAAAAFQDALKHGQQFAPGEATTGRRYYYEATITSDLGNTLLAIGANYLKRGQPNEATGYFQQAVQQHTQALAMYPWNARFRERLAAVYLWLKRPDLAESTAMEAWNSGLRDDSVRDVLKLARELKKQLGGKKK